MVRVLSLPLIIAALLVPTAGAGCSDENPTIGPDAELVFAGTIVDAAFADGLAYVVNSGGLFKSSSADPTPTLRTEFAVDLVADGDSLVWLTAAGDVIELKPDGSVALVTIAPGRARLLARTAGKLAVAFRRSVDPVEQSLFFGEVTALETLLLDQRIEALAVDDEAAYFLSAPINWPYPAVLMPVNQVGKVPFGASKPLIVGEPTDETSQGFAALAAAGGKAYVIENFANGSWGVVALGPDVGERSVLFMRTGNCAFLGERSIAVDDTHAYVVAAFESSDTPAVGCTSTEAVVRIPLAGGPHERIYQRPISSEDLWPRKVFAVTDSDVYVGFPAVGEAFSIERLMRIAKP